MPLREQGFAERNAGGHVVGADQQGPPEQRGGLGRPVVEQQEITEEKQWLLVGGIELNGLLEVGQRLVPAAIALQLKPSSKLARADDGKR